MYKQWALLIHYFTKIVYANYFLGYTIKNYYWIYGQNKKNSNNNNASLWALSNRSGLPLLGFLDGAWHQIGQVCYWSLLLCLFFFFTCVITAHISYVCQKKVEIEATVGTGSPKTGMEKIFQSCPISVKLYILWCLFLAERNGKQCGLLSIHFLCCLERRESRSQSQLISGQVTNLLQGKPRDRQPSAFTITFTPMSN